MRAREYERRRFARVYTEAAMRLQAKVDRPRERLSGPATRRLLEREVAEYGHPESARLAKISVGQLYTLRKRPDYRIVMADLDQSTGRDLNRGITGGNASQTHSRCMTSRLAEIRVQLVGSLPGVQHGRSILRPLVPGAGVTDVVRQTPT